jgi:hypothetical protein
VKLFVLMRMEKDDTRVLISNVMEMFRILEEWPTGKS